MTVDSGPSGDHEKDARGTCFMPAVKLQLYCSFTAGLSEGIVRIMEK
jgi:hypothetical protein